MRPRIVVRNIWDNCAKPDLNFFRLRSKDNARIRSHLLPFLENLSPARPSILDLAAGLDNSFYYPASFDMSLVTAVDISPALLEMNPSGRKICADARYPLGFPDSAFDLIFCKKDLDSFSNYSIPCLLYNTAKQYH